MKREIKIKFNNYNERTFINSFPTRVLFENFNIKKVNKAENADVIFEVAHRWGNSDLSNKDKTRVMISHENLFFKRSFFSVSESVIRRAGFKKEKYKIMDFLDKFIPKFISDISCDYFLPKHVKFINNIKNNIDENAFAIICNDVKSDNIIQMPLFVQEYFGQLSLLTRKKNFLEKRKFCAFIVSSNSGRDRIRFFRKLSKYKKVNSYGRVLNNMGDRFFKKHWENNSKIFSNYKFVICFENSFADGYITEKLPNVMFSGTIPIYRGAPNIGKYFNTKSFINYEDYNSYDKMIKRIIELDNDDEKYKKFSEQQWFKENKVPKIIIKKEKELIKFYRKVFR